MLVLRVKKAHGLELVIPPSNRERRIVVCSGERRSARIGVDADSDIAIGRVARVKREQAR